MFDVRATIRVDSSPAQKNFDRCFERRTYLRVLSDSRTSVAGTSCSFLIHARFQDTSIAASNVRRQRNVLW